MRCTCQTAKYKDQLLVIDDEADYEGELEFLPFNFCPFCGKKIDRSWQSATVGSGGDCDGCNKDNL